MLKRFRGHYAWYALSFFFLYFAFGVFSSILSIYLTGIGKSGSEMSFIISASSLFSIVLLPVVGYLCDYTGKSKWVAAVLFLLSAVLAVLFAISRNTWLLFCLNGLIIFAINAILPIYEKLASSSRHRYGIVRVWGGVGFAVAAQTAGYVYQFLHPTAIYVLFSAAAVLATVFLLATDSPDQSRAKAVPEKVLLPWNNRNLLLFFFVAFVFAGSTGVSTTYLPVMFVQMGMSAAQAGTLLFFATLMEIPILLFSNRFMDRFSGKTLLMANFAIVAVQFGVYGFLPFDWAVITAAVLLKSSATMLFIMVSLKVVVTLVDERLVTTALSLTATCKYLGTVVFQNISGSVVDAAGITVLYQMLAATALAGLLLSAVLRMENRDGIFAAGESEPM